MHTATKEEGPIGKERLYYLDLDSKHVSSLRLKEEVTYNDDIHVINLLKDDVKVGFIALEQNDNKMNISAIEVNKKNRNEGIA